MELVLVNPESKEWDYMWNWLGNHPINEGYADPTSVEHNGEAWQYTGSYKQDKRVLHSFRHKNHPRTGKIERLSVKASDDITDDDIVKNYKL